MSVRKNTKIIAKFFKKDDWRYEFDEKANLFRCGVLIGNAVGNVDIFLSVAEDRVTCMYILPLSAPEETRTAVSELVSAG